MSSPQPEPIDDIAGMRPAPPGREAPCDVQVRYGYGARDLMLPSHRMLSSDGATPRSHGRRANLQDCGRKRKAIDGLKRAFESWRLTL